MLATAKKTHLRVVLLIAIAALFLTSRQQLEAITDADGDGIDDAFEQQLAETFLPTMHVQNADWCPYPIPRPVLFRARHPFDGAVETDYILINYVTLYYCDAGSNWLFGFTGHEGDNEAFEVFLKYWDSDSSWHFDSISAVQHWGDKRLWCEGSDASNTDEIWVGNDKHGSYAARSDCGCWGDDDCGGSYYDVGGVLYNVGEPNAQLMNDLGVVESSWSGQTIWNNATFEDAGIITEQLHNGRFYTITASPAWLSCARSCDDTLWDCQVYENDQDGHCEARWEYCYSMCGGGYIGYNSWYAD